MDFHRWTDRSQPQTLQSVVILLYINAIFGVLGLIGLGIFGSNAEYGTLFFLAVLKTVGVIKVIGGNLYSTSHLATPLLDLISVALVAAQALAGLSLANERKWGYRFAVILMFVELAGVVAGAADFGGAIIFSLSGLINVLFLVVMLVLLLHRQSREYQRVWFR